MSTTEVNATLALTGTETLTAAEAPHAANDNERVLYASDFRTVATLNADTTPKVDMPPLVAEIELSGSPETIDLTAAAALVTPAAATRLVDYTGAKLIGFSLVAAAGNADDITIATGSVDGYTLPQRNVGPGATEAMCFTAAASNYPAVSPTVKNIDIDGTSGDSCSLVMYFGT